ncbi:MAG: radical SAM protein [Planctomycetes bacterium]|nr:radical SAM protein [Planctomycetota bacterium]
MGLSPKSIHPEPTNICNSNCVFCPQPSLRRDRGIMSFNLYSRLMDEVFELGCRSLILYWMADPLGDPQIFRKIEYAKVKGFDVFTSTNAGQLTAEKSKRLFATGLDKLNISLEGTDPDVYGKIRCGLDYQTTVNNVERFFRLKNERGSSKPYVVMRTVYMSTTADSVEDYIRKWREQSDQIDIASVANWAGNSDYDTRRNAGQHGIKRKPCARLWRDICITWDGIAAPCFFDSDLHYPLGSVHDHSLVDLFNHPLMVELRQMHQACSFSNHPLCANCDENVARESNPDIKLIDRAGKRISLERQNKSDLEAILQVIPDEFGYKVESV